MKVKLLLRIVVILAVMAVSSLSVSVHAQTAPAPPQTQNPGAAPNQGAGQGAHAQPQGALRILSPRAGAQLHQNFVDVHYELTNPGVSASSSPNFQVQLDSRDPVTTNATSYTFNGLRPGKHTLIVEVVDANGTPIAGARSEVQFVVLGSTPAPSSAILPWDRRPSVISAALRVEEPQQRPRNDDEKLPSAAGALPLLSVIGFGVLLGGIASAMKTRPK